MNMSERIFEFQLAGTRSNRKVSVDMVEVISVEELEPFQEVDRAYCKVTLRNSPDVLRLVSPYKQVFDIWKRVTAHAEG